MSLHACQYMAFIFKYIFLIGFFCSIFSVKTLASLYRYDQVVPTGCRVKWNGHSSFFAKLFGSSMPNDLQLECDNPRTAIDYWYTRLGSDDLTWNLFGNCGSQSGMCRSGYEPGIWWVDGGKTNADGKASVHVCNSFFALLWIQESCRWISEGDSDSSFNINIGTLSAYRIEVNEIDPGTSTNNSVDEVNKSGYMYGIFNNDDPYDGTYTSTGAKTIRPGYTITNNCKLLRDFYTPSGCPDSSKCPCSEPFPPIHPSCQSCYSQDQTPNSTMPTGCGSKNNGGFDICDSTHTTNCCDNSGLIQCNKYRIPITMDPSCTTADQSKCYFDPNVKSLTSTQKQCYACNATAQTVYNICTKGVSGKYDKIVNLPNDAKNTTYGSGSYVCASFKTLSATIRAGCFKFPLGIPPKYFPRIATSNNPQVNNLFQPIASVRQFKDIDYTRAKPQFGICGYGLAELGEQYRGNFFNPYIQIVYGENDQQIKFTTNILADMSQTYGAISPGARNYGMIYSPWNTTNPVSVPYGTKDSSCPSNPTLDSNNLAFVCTRIEYDGEEDAGYFTAYQITQTPGTTLTAATVGSCNSYCSNTAACGSNVINIGKVPRPPLRYGYTPNGTPVMPLSVSSANVGANPSAPNIITLNPANSRSDFPNNLIGLNIMETFLTPQYYDVEHYDTTTPSSLVKTATPCGILFGHQYCLTRDPCSLLWDFDQYCTTSSCINSITGSCAGGDVRCQTYQTLVKSCGNKTYCNRKYNNVASCFNYKPPKLVNVTVGGTSPALQPLSYYQQNIQWQDESCISSGFAYAQHTSLDPNTVTSDLKYGNSGSPLYDQVIAYINTDQRNTPRRPIRISAQDDDNAASTIIPISANIKTATDAAILLANAIDQSGNNIGQLYFGTIDVPTISALIGIRNRTAREMTLCGVNFRDNFVDWSLVFNPGPGWYDIYLPLRCQFFEYGIKGGQGGGTSLINMASPHFGTGNYIGFASGQHHDWGCVGSAWNAVFTPNDTNGNIRDRYVPWIECENQGYGGDYYNIKYNSINGSDSGKNNGITNNLVKRDTFLSFFIGKGATTLIRSPVYKIDPDNDSIKWDYRNHYNDLFCLQNCTGSQRCGFQGAGYYGEQSSLIAATSALPPSNLTESSTFVTSDTAVAYSIAYSGQSNIYQCLTGTIPGGNAIDRNFNIANSGNVYGDNSFSVGTVTGTSVAIGNSNSFYCKSSSGQSEITAVDTGTIEQYASQARCCNDGSFWNFVDRQNFYVHFDIFASGNSSSGSGHCSDSTATNDLTLPYQLYNAGNNGTAQIAAAKIKVDATSNPIYINDYQKQMASPTIHGIRDPQCTPMCPRINIKVPINTGNGTTDYICEYGGVGYDINSLFVTLDKYDFQVPAGFTAVPTRCFSANDGGRRLIYPTRDYFNATCNTRYTVTDNNRWYGLCANSNVENDYLKQFFLNTKNYFAMAGTYCPGGNSCPQVRPADIQSNQNIAYNINLLDELSYGLKCLTGGMWANTYGGVNTAIRRISDANLHISCPPVNENFTFSPWWSANATWPLSSPGASVSGACLTGYVPYSAASGVSRKCGLSGIWEAVANINQNVCLYTCPLKIDIANNIQWASPASFSNPVSIPTCLSGPGTIYRSVNGRIESQTIQMNYTPDTGHQLIDFVLTCNMPSASNPSSFLDVSQYTTDRNKKPLWATPLVAAKCVPPSFSGSCSIANAPNVCYDAGANGNPSFATCDTGFIYQVNGIPIYPPKQRISGHNLTTLTPITDINLLEDEQSISCTINGPSGNGASATCNSLSTKLQISYYDSLTGATYKNFINTFSTSNATVNSLSAQNVSTAIKNKLISNISNNVPSDVSSCTINSSLAAHPASSALLNYMTARDYCGQICYVASPPAGQQNLQFFDCTAISTMPSNLQCTPICGSNSETWYYYTNGFGWSTSDGTDINNHNTYGVGHTPPLTANNSPYCIQQGIVNAANSLTGGTIGTISDYCSSATYSASLEILAGTETSTSVNNPVFAGQFNSSRLSCWVPRNCTLPNSLGTLNHQSSVWNFVFDANHGFSYTATQNQTCPTGGNKYNITINNSAFFKLYCYDGTLFKTDQISNNTLNYSATPATCFASSPQIRDITAIISSAYLQNITNLPTINGAEEVSHNIITDSTANSFANIYDNLTKLDIAY